MKRGLLLYVLLINIAAFAVCIHDKRAARKGRWRVSERTLWGCALAFGAPGLYAGMHLVRHKTQKRRFVIGIPLLCAVQMAMFAFAFYTLTNG